MDSQIIEERSYCWYNPRSWYKWCPTSLAELRDAEKKMFTHIMDSIEMKFISINNGAHQIRTISTNTTSNNTPLVLVHGFGSGCGLWAMNLPSLSENRPVYAFDVLGFGRSSRPKFSSESSHVELELVESIESWRRTVGLEHIILLGHSLGGFLASAYTLHYPSRVKHLILVDPWGFPDKESVNNQSKKRTTVPRWIKTIAWLISPFNPLAGLRAVGPWGPGVMRRARPDLIAKFYPLYKDDDTLVNYLYHINVQTPSGEEAFRHLSIPIGWARNPMVNRIKELDSTVPITFMNGSRSWIDSSSGWDVKHQRHNSYVDVQIIRGAGHHVYADQKEEFNKRVNKICESSDTGVIPLPVKEREEQEDINPNITSLFNPSIVHSPQSEVPPLTEL